MGKSKIKSSILTLNRMEPMQPSPICYELKIQIPELHKDAAALILQELGEPHFVEGILDCDVPFDYDPDFFQRDHYELMNVQSPLFIYNEDKNRLEELSSHFSRLFENQMGPDTPCLVEVSEFKEQNWRESWKASFKPVVIGSEFVILPPWEDVKNWSHIDHSIVIDPGMAFGTGQHETTQACLELLTQLHFVPKSVLDVGTGSGILAIAAHKKGSQEIMGNDIDAESVNIAQNNALDNGIQGIQFTSDPISLLPLTTFELIFANIQFKPLSVVMPEIVKRMNSKSVLVLSGVLDVEYQDFVDQVLSPHELKTLHKIVLKDWCGLRVQLG